ncbi:phosphoenolpyruvate synthase [Candidatus Beckwithbacteria bacterium CG10_big_fil_rev_8_21_14_0_10_34_10]|uniref:Phosphoenolpyruvate synthase n=1 Tax=Candidatus Beckwithbacteria bacterium CG10_big_fil_rev_8_21_14_0_10_34_10 TaxID=1974495 RepID=A0A2H0WAF8_9BACT|nr:MAG: phosphoenolpyruvate synthase [Candidatus Beckwithbacteria bacterium CG10_big_fil_rev_8_21_14_0_10_34_10]
MEKKQLHIVWFNQIDRDDISLVGGKGANLGEMVKAKFPIPNGFIVTAEAYWHFINSNKIKDEIEKILRPVNVHDPRQLTRVSQDIKKLILKSQVPKDLSMEIIKNYEELSGGVGRACLIAARSSATAEDLPDASFAGQQETFLNIKGEANLINKVRACWASLFTPRAIFYREEKKFDHFKVGIAVVVQKMIQAKTSGVMFTIDPVTNDKSKIIIEGIYGLGELIVQGSVTPDHYEVDRQSFKIIKKDIREQKVQLIKKDRETKNIKVKKYRQKKQKISDSNIKELAQYGKALHQHYFFPQDIEWGIEKSKIYILQTRPVTTIPSDAKIKLNQEEVSKIDLPLLVKGDPASPGIAGGFAKLIKSPKMISELKYGEVLLTKMTTPDFVPAMKRASAIITDKGGQTSHAAIVSRELGVPCIVGTKTGTKIIKNGEMVTVNGKTGEVFKGGLKILKKNIQPKTKTLGSYPLASEGNEKMPGYLSSHLEKIKTATKLYVNLAEPDLAAKVAQKDVDGVGLLRAEFMISQEIKQHPKKLIEDKKQKFFIDKLAEGLEKFCTAFEPRPVVYRATDFKTNEYRNLIGGKRFEPEEENPLIGFRGALRYVNNRNVFEMELKAIKKVREKYNNLWLMIPFIRTVNELKEVKKIVSTNGLIRSTSFQLWMMAEVPSNVLILEDFIKAGIDGISIGSNDLTMLVLGIDRDNEELGDSFDVQDKAVLKALKMIIKTSLKNKISVSICGQAPSLYPSLTQKLVGWGITSVSVSPDMIDQTREIIFEAEKRRTKK